MFSSADPKQNMIAKNDPCLAELVQKFKFLQNSCIFREVIPLNGTTWALPLN